MKSRNERPVVYFLRCDKTRRIKIGASSETSLRARMSSFRVAHASSVRLLGTIPGTHATEAALHLAFRASFVRGEWFRESPELRRFIADFVTPPESEPRDRLVAIGRLVPVRSLAALAGVPPCVVRSEIAAGRVPGVTERTTLTIPRRAALAWLRAKPTPDCLAAVAAQGVRDQEAAGKSTTFLSYRAKRA